MAGVDRIPISVLANKWAASSGEKELSDVVDLIGFFVEVAQDRGRPMEGSVVTKKSGVGDDLKQGGR